MNRDDAIDILTTIRQKADRINGQIDMSEQSNSGSFVPILLALNMAALAIFATFYVVEERQQNARIARVADAPVLVFDRGIFTDDMRRIGIPADRMQGTFDALIDAAENAGYIVLLNTDASVLTLPRERVLRIADFLNVTDAVPTSAPALAGSGT